MNNTPDNTQKSAEKKKNATIWPLIKLIGILILISVIVQIVGGILGVLPPEYIINGELFAFLLLLAVGYIFSGMKGLSGQDEHLNARFPSKWLRVPVCVVALLWGIAGILLLWFFPGIEAYQQVFQKERSGLGVKLLSVFVYPLYICVLVGCTVGKTDKRSSTHS